MEKNTTIETTEPTPSKFNKWHKAALVATVALTAVGGVKAGVEVVHYNHTGEAPAVTADPLSWISTPIAEGVITVEEQVDQLITPTVEQSPIVQQDKGGPGLQIHDIA